MTRKVLLGISLLVLVMVLVYAYGLYSGQNAGDSIVEEDLQEESEDTLVGAVEKEPVSVSEEDVEAESGSAVVKEEMAVIIAEDVNIRSLPGDEEGSAVIGKAIKGDAFLYIAQNEEWCEIIYDDSTHGFVSLEFVKLEIRESTKQEKETGMETGERLIVIDAGHQAKPNYEEEPVGPGAKETKVKVAAGTQGAASGLKEYELTLEVSLLLQQELESRGYEVIMIRTKNEVNISNSERAEIANHNEADAFVRIHANGSEDTSVSGSLTICPTEENPYCAAIYKESRLLAEEILEAMTARTGAIKERVWETDTMSGINWCQVPVTIVEMGYMTNKEEDLKMSDTVYQKKLATGIADGIDNYFQNLSPGGKVIDKQITVKDVTDEEEIKRKTTDIYKENTKE